MENLVTSANAGLVFTAPTEELERAGYLVLPRPFDIQRVNQAHQTIRNTFSRFSNTSDETHRTLYEVNEEDETHMDPRFYEQGKVAIPRIEYKGRPGYRQLMMTLDFSAEFANLHCSGKHYEWGVTHGQEDIKKSLDGFASVIDLFSTQAMESIFAPVVHGDNSYCGFLLNDSAPHSVCFGYHYELHQDRHENAIVVSVQLSPTTTPWKIGRDLDGLETIVQQQGSMIVMEAHDYVNRMSPWHMPCIGENPRNAAVIVFEGTYRDRFVTWLAEHGRACGYYDQ